MRNENCKRAAAATRHSVRVLLSLLHSRCYDAQHLKSWLSTAPLLRHLHGHCVVCYTVQCWLVFVMIISVEEKRGKGSCWCALSPGLFWQNCIFYCLTSRLVNTSLVSVWRLKSCDGTFSAALSLADVFRSFLLGMHYIGIYSFFPLFMCVLGCVWNVEVSEMMP